jgi:serine protease Do
MMNEMRNRIPSRLVVLTLLALPGIALAAERSRRGDAVDWRRRSGAYEKNHASVTAAFTDTVRDAAAATVRVYAKQKPVALGAIVDSQGHVVTKSSLVEEQPIACQLRDGRRLPAEVVGRDERADIALLKIEADELASIQWREGELPDVGSLLATVDVADRPLAIGVVASETREIKGATKAKSKRGVLGVQLAGAGNQPRIDRVVEDSAADDAGLHVGDMITKVDGQPMKSVEELIRTIGSHAPGKKVKLLVRRGGRYLDFEVTLGKPSNGFFGKASEDQWGGGPFSDRRYGFERVLPHDMPIHPADCGGPVVDLDGRVVGINIARAIRVTTYALPAKTVQKVVEELKGKGVKE